MVRSVSWATSPSSLASSMPGPARSPSGWMRASGAPWGRKSPTRAASSTTQPAWLARRISAASLTDTSTPARAAATVRPAGPRPGAGPAAGWPAG